LVFHSLGDLGGNREIILWHDGRQNGLGTINHVLQTTGSLSRNLMETFLMKDGTRFIAQTDYATKTFTEVFKNREPHFAQVFAYPGFVTEEGNN
jgi:hypothetical protein